MRSFKSLLERLSKLRDKVWDVTPPIVAAQDALNEKLERNLREHIKYQESEERSRRRSAAIDSAGDDPSSEEGHERWLVAARKALKTVEEQERRRRLAITGTQARRRRHTPAGRTMADGFGDMRLDQGEDMRERERVFGWEGNEEEPPMPRRREAILATKAKLKRKAEGLDE